MARMFGQELSKQDILKRVGDISQFATVKQFEFKTGMAKGVHGIDVKMADGLSFTLLPDRGMDIAWGDYKGIPLGFISKTGVVSPNFYDPRGKGFLKSFYAGLLTTCGLTQMGAPCIDEGVELSQHGRYSHIISEDVSVLRQWNGDDYHICIRGVVRESTMFGENITLTREIHAKLGGTEIQIKDSVENCGFDPQPLMLLYHCNFGYPIVSENTTLSGLMRKPNSRDAEAEKGIEVCHTYDKPQHGYKEQVFFYEPEGPKGLECACLFNRSLNLGAYVKFDNTQLPYFTQWKQIGEGDYVVGLEPGTYYPVGRAQVRMDGKLRYIEPGEIKNFDLTIGVTESQPENNN